MNVDKLKAYASRNANVRKLADALHDCRDVKMRSIREQSASEINAIYYAQGHGLMFCLHDVMYFHACAKCKRTEREANDNRDAFMRTHNINP